jgi:acetyl esterase/lipase
MSMVTIDLALQHILWQAGATMLFVYAGALSEWPGVAGLGITLLSWLGLARIEARKARAVSPLRAALVDEFGPAAGSALGHPPLALRRLGNPFKRHDARIKRDKDIPYGPHGERNLLDVYTLEERPPEPRPVLIWVHGGAWVMGDKEQQGQPLIQTLVPAGWVVVSINYRLSPAAVFPDHLIDDGGDPNFVAACGGSAGGHLVTLAAFTPGDPEYQPGFENADTSLDACLPLYANFDFTNRYGLRDGGAEMASQLFKQGILADNIDDDPEAWKKASPVYRVTPDAPPFCILHGCADSLLWLEETREFVRELREVSKEPVVYAEIPNAQHAYDMFFGRYAIHSAHMIERFLAHSWERKRAAIPS